MAKKTGKYSAERDLILRNYNFLKGGTAEVLVERLFITLGMEIFPVGVEKSVPRLAQLIRNKKVKTKAIQRFEYGPDFIVVAPDGDTFPVEVKFRSNASLNKSDVKKYDDPNLVFIVLGKTRFYSFKKSEFEFLAGKKATLKLGEDHLLTKSPDFHFSPEQKLLITGYEEFISNFFEFLRGEQKMREDIESRMFAEANICFSDFCKTNFNKNNGS